MFGFNQGELFVNNNLHEYDLCYVQEHWLYPSTLSDLDNINPDFFLIMLYRKFQMMIYFHRVDHMVVLQYSGKRNYLQ